jgi:hypothetical protein
MKRLLIALVVLLAIGAVGAYLAFNYLDVIVKMALEHYGPDVTGVSVKVGEVQISPRNGRGAIRGLELGSPSGFSAPRSARFGEIRLAIDPATLTSPVVRVRELVIESPHITYEKAAGSTNLDAIQKRIEAYVKAADAADGKGDGKGDGGRGTSTKRRFIIDRLAIRGVRVTMTNPALRGQGVGFDLPDIELRGIGQRQNGVTASEAANVVASTFQQRIAQKVLTNIDLLRRGGVEGAVDALRGLLK